MSHTYQNELPYSGDRRPLTAALLSIMPGLGQLYIGERRKGILFLDVAFFNYLLLCMVCFSGQIIQTLQSFAVTYRFSLNGEILSALQEAHLGSPVSVCVIAFVVLFVLFAATDAYDKAFGIKRRQIYGDSIIDFSEATSGSYIAHVALMVSCLVLAAFFIHPPLRINERTTITFELQQTAPKVHKRPDTPVRAPQEVEKHGRKRLEPTIVKEHSAPVRPPEKLPTPNVSKPVPASASVPAPPRVPTPPSVNPVPQPIAPQPMRTATPNAPTATARTMDAPKPPTPMPINTASAHAAVMQMIPHATTSAGIGMPSLPRPILSGTAAPRGFLMPISTPQSFAIASSSFAEHAGIPKALSPDSGFGSAPAPVNVATGPAGSSGPVKLASVRPGGSSTTSNKSTGDPSGVPTPIRGSNVGPGHSASGFVVTPKGSPIGSHGGPSGEGLTNPRADTDNEAPSDATKIDVDYSAYMADLQRRIKKSWFPPRNTENLRTVVQFAIHRDGTMTALRIVHSGGLSGYDDAAIKAVQTASPFRALPAGSPESVDIEFTFDFNVLRTSGGRFSS